MRLTSPYFHVVRGADGREHLEVNADGIVLLRFVLTNKGTAFTLEERRALKLEGLLPPAVNTLDQQVERAYVGFQAAPTPIAKYQFLRALQERQEILFFALLERHLEQMLPIVYTPTVGQAVQEFSALYQHPRGLSLSPENIDRAQEIVQSYPLDDVRMIVVTDSSAILGIGDQGYGGLAIPVGKLALYTVAGGVSPFHTMPVVLDVGTERKDLLDDPFYLGVRRRRLTGEAYYAFMDRFVEAVRERWPRAVVQWEDLAKESAFTVLDRFRHALPSFNDDIQGTGAVALAGLVNACRISGTKLEDQVVVVHGAGAGGIGVASVIRDGMMRAGLSREAATARVFVLDSKGLLVQGRDVEAYKRPFLKPLSAIAGWKKAGAFPSLEETIEQARATALLGLSGQAGAFGERAVRAVAANVARPIVFPLSNPTSSCEATPSDVLAWTDGQAIVATGSPFEPVKRGEKTFPIGQGNNAFVFPGLGFGAILSGARDITDGMVLDASEALADYTREVHGASGLVYPPVAELRDVAVRVAARVVVRAWEDGVAVHKNMTTEAVEAWVRSQMWNAEYLPYEVARR